MRCQQLITVDENENQPREMKFGTQVTFSVYIKIPVEKVRISFHRVYESWLVFFISAVNC